MLITGQIRVGLYHEQKMPNSVRGNKYEGLFNNVNRITAPGKRRKRTTVNITSGSLAVATYRVPLIDKALIQGNGPLWSLPLLCDSILSTMSHCKSPLAPLVRRPGGSRRNSGLPYPEYQ